MKKIIFLSFMIMTSLFLVSCDTATALLDQNSVNVESLQVYTLDELSQYSGANGSTAYIAVDGIVYDVTNEFVNGTHQGFQIGGTDATAIFAASPHSASLLATLPIVGTIGDASISVSTEPDTTTSNTTTTSEALPVFTLTELAQYTGANGSTAYISVNGVIYDVTNEFSNGTHQGLQIGGTDATAVFASSPHSASLLATLQVVGSLEGSALIYTDSVIVTDPSNNTYDDDDYDDDDYDDDYDDDDNDDDDYTEYDD